ncbi:MAG: 16S rRNA (guanine(966)-N(2))-methyltransferase RsmD [Rickettsiales bacterium]|jgi:16S rRNA (guanine966-N2)-methyltransferase|nr:16S rRNA (guanine(966)-N(2))-methyltransferase RsmD [Rickettsiales bacterium]
MRVIAGKHRGRPLLSPSDKGIRPTSSKMRSSLFDILSSGRFLNEDGNSVVEGAKVVDLCCGTGALGIEALSRGASMVTFIDGSAEHLKLAWSNICYLKEEDKSTLIRIKAENLPKAKDKFNLVFIDPPYFKKIADKALISLINRDWLEKGAIMVVEQARIEDLSFSSEFYKELDVRVYGNSKFTILESL